MKTRFLSFLLSLFLFLPACLSPIEEARPVVSFSILSNGLEMKAFSYALLRSSGSIVLRQNGQYSLDPSKIYLLNVNQDQEYILSVCLYKDFDIDKAPKLCKEISFDTGLALRTDLGLLEFIVSCYPGECSQSEQKRCNDNAKWEKSNCS